MALVLVTTVAYGQSKPFHDFRETPLEYVGARSVEPPADLSEVLIGWFGPSDAADPRHGDLWVAASMAVEEANAGGGFQGLPFRLVPRWSENPWGTGIAEVARMVYEDGVWAIVGSVDGPGTHLAEQVVAKARLPLVSPVATDDSVNLAGVPWMFSVAPGDHLWAPVLLDELLEAETFALVAATDHDSRLSVQELMNELADRGHGPVFRIDVRPGPDDLESLFERLRSLNPAALLLVAGAEESARLVRAVRERGYGGTIFGTPQMGRRRFAQAVGGAGGGVRYPLLFDPEDSDFVRRFRERTGSEPDWAAAHTYDAVRVLVAAIRRAGLDRAGIRDALARLGPWSGVTGMLEWDPTGQNCRQVRRVGQASP